MEERIEGQGAAAAALQGGGSGAPVTVSAPEVGVEEPIRVGVLETVNGALTARELPQTEIDEHLQAIKSAEQSLRAWRDALQSGAAAQDVPPAPEPGDAGGVAG